MARKNPFLSVMNSELSPAEKPALDYTIRGASKSILNSIGEIAARADKLLEGETVVELDPTIIDGSFVRDRIEDDEQEFSDLVEAIRDRGQDSPILVRPHPEISERYMVVFGHRRLRAAKHLGRKVRAVVKDLKDADHLLAQGQENSARASLSFIEKAMFAHQIARLHPDNDNRLVMSALSLDKATLSKMLSVASIPTEIVTAVGAAKGIGRDRWYELKSLLEKPANLKRAIDYIATDEFVGKRGDERFNSLLHCLKASANGRKQSAARVQKWTSQDKSLAVDLRSDGRTYTLALKAKEAVGFGDYLSERLPELFEAYRNRDQQGD
jgi:ParB family chromosome partitioning protein